MISRHFFGRVAEYLAVFIYSIKMYDIVRYNYRSKLGQIDLIAKRGNHLVFIEVKARSSLEGDYLISMKQQLRIRRSAENFIRYNTKYSNYEIRFDLVVFTLYGMPKIFENAF